MHRAFRLGRSVAAGAILTLVAAACVSNSAGGSGGGGTGGTQTGGVIKIGLIAPQSGFAASVGRNMAEGVQIAVDELNAKGGVLGNQLQIVQRDDQFDPSKDPQAARELIDQEHVSMIIGPAGTTNWLAIKGILDQSHVVDYPIVTDPVLKSNIDPWTFRLMIPDSIEIPPLVDYAVKHYSKVAIIAEDAETGHSQIKLVQQEMARLGKSLVDVEKIDPNGLIYDPQVLNLKKSGAQAVILGTHIGPTAARVLNAAQANGYHPQWFGLAGMTSYTVADLARDQVVGMIFIAPANPLLKGKGVSANEQHFVREYLQRYAPDGIRSESGANKLIGAEFLTYDGVKMWAQAAAKATSFDPAAVQRVFNGGFTFGPADSSANLTWTYSSTDHEGFHANDAWFYQWVKDSHGIEFKFFGDAATLVG